MPRFWWVNQNQTYRAEVGGGYLWSPKVNRNGGFNQFYQNMTDLRPGDIIFSFADTYIKTVGVVSAPARSVERPIEFGKAGDAWDSDGWLVLVEYEELDKPFVPKDHMQLLKPLLPNKYSPIRADGGGNQVYLAEISEAMANALFTLADLQQHEAVEESQKREIQNRTDISVTMKYQLIQARVGQGKFRKNLENIESACRVTGVADRRFLIASHVKPWVDSNDIEKIDGNNGLLLCPHIDRLFDRGYISFDDNGALLLSKSLPKHVASAWGLSNTAADRPLTNKQATYMDYHRKEIFEKR